jgi:hypothetical protein
MPFALLNRSDRGSDLRNYTRDLDKAKIQSLPSAPRTRSKHSLITPSGAPSPNHQKVLSDVTAGSSEQRRIQQLQRLVAARNDLTPFAKVDVEGSNPFFPWISSARTCHSPGAAPSRSRLRLVRLAPYACSLLAARTWGRAGDSARVSPAKNAYDRLALGTRAATHRERQHCHKGYAHNATRRLQHRT